MAPKQTTKKRKHENIDDVQDHSDNDELMSEKQELTPSTIARLDESVFEEMTRVNSQLISLAGKMKLVDHRYFFNHSAIVDEFVGNIEEFLKEIAVQRRKLASERLNSDMLFHILQFLDQYDLLTSAQLVCKKWQDVLGKFSYSAKFECISNTTKVNSSVVKSLMNNRWLSNFTRLELNNAGADCFEAISKSKKLHNITQLKMENNLFGKQAVKALKKAASLKNFTDLSLRNAKTGNQSEFIELLSSDFVQKVTKLDMKSNYGRTFFDTDFFKKVSKIEHFSKLTHLNLSKSNSYSETNVIPFLKDKTQLEYLNLTNLEIGNCPTFSSTIETLKNLTTLKISGTNLTANQLISIILSPNLTKLTTLKAHNWSDRGTEVVIDLSSNTCESSLTSLDLSNASITAIASITSHCPKLKKLNLNHQNSMFRRIKYSNTYEIMLNTPTLSELEYLDISNINWMEKLYPIIFTAPFFEKLTTLICFSSNADQGIEAELLEDCKNLVNLKTFKGSVKTASGKDALSSNKTFSKLECIEYQY